VSCRGHDHDLTMGNCLKSPTSDDVSLLREGSATNASGSGEQIESTGGSHYPSAQVRSAQGGVTHAQYLLILNRCLC
jgi:hypothetical protein